MTNHGGDIPDSWNNSGERRRDGLYINQDPGGTWSIYGPNGQTLKSTCPCCGKTMPTKRSARLVADMMIPYVDPVNALVRADK